MGQSVLSKAVQWPSLDGKVALVTGASSGLGAAFAEALVQAGANVALGARRLEACRQLAERLDASGAQAMPVALDVNDATSVAGVLEAVERRWGGIDLLVNNAGVAATTPLLDQPEAEWDRIVDTNLRGPFLVGQAVARSMVAGKRGGTIVNIASILGFRIAGSVGAYAASKAGLVQLTRTMSLEWARYGIRVNALCPGYIETDINRAFFASAAGEAMIRRIPQRRLGRADELIGPLLFLCSDASSYVTGSALVVDGGHLNSTL